MEKDSGLVVPVSSQKSTEASMISLQYPLVKLATLTVIAEVSFIFAGKAFVASSCQ
jgi:hypothetical protein